VCRERARDKGGGCWCEVLSVAAGHLQHHSGSQSFSGKRKKRTAGPCTRSPGSTKVHIHLRFGCSSSPLSVIHGSSNRHSGLLYLQRYLLMPLAAAAHECRQGPARHLECAFSAVTRAVLEKIRLGRTSFRSVFSAVERGRVELLCAPPVTFLHSASKFNGS
jgi:hypothetical protein